jgi:predicted anti-sigma-YlaC factor YlaD
LTAPDTQLHLPPCLTSEEIAGFLDGVFATGDCARITAHLASCESCYELFAGAAHVLSHLGEATLDSPAGTDK